MILGLILATVDQLSQPEESLLDYRPVMSPLAYRTFPADEYLNARRRAGMHKSSTLDVTRVPSLVEILLHRIRTWGDKVDTRSHEEQLEASNLWQLLQANTPFYHHYPCQIAHACSWPFSHKRSSLRISPADAPDDSNTCCCARQLAWTVG